VKRRCLIVCGDEFLGRYLADELVAARIDVAVASEAAGAYRSAGVSHRYALELPSPRLHTIMTDFRPAVCIHIPGRETDASVKADPSAARAAQIDPLVNVLEAVRGGRPRCHVVYVSSAAVYGRPTRLPVDESQRLAPCSADGFHKLAGEAIAEEYRAVHELRLSIARLFSAYGPYERPHLFADLCRRAGDSRDHTLDIFGSGDDERDYIHVRDAAAGLARIALRPRAAATVPATADSRSHTAVDPPHVFNIGTGRAVNSATVARQVAATFSPEMNVRLHGRHEASDVSRLRADISRLKALGFVPKVSLEDGLAEYIRWFQAHRHVKIPA